MTTKQQPKPRVWRLECLRDGTAFGWPDVPGVVQGTVVSKNSCEVTVRLPDDRLKQWGPGTEVVVLRAAPVPAPTPAPPPAEAVLMETEPLPDEIAQIAPEPRSQRKGRGMAPKAGKRATIDRGSKAGNPKKQPGPSGGCTDTSVTSPGWASRSPQNR